MSFKPPCVIFVSLIKPESTDLVRSRPGRPGDWQVWIRPISGLDAALCAVWTRKSLATAPAEFLRTQPWPKSPTAAKRTVAALVDYLKAVARPVPAFGPRIGEHSELFTDASTSPRDRSLAAQGKPYSPASVVTYRNLWKHNIQPDTELCSLRMEEATRNSLEAYFARLLDRLGGPCRTHQGVWALLHMVFAQYFRDAPYPSPARHQSLWTRLCSGGRNEG